MTSMGEGNRSKLSLQKAKASSVEIIVETPKGSRNKYKYDPDNDVFKLSKVLPEGMVFPYDFGFVPSTKAADGDPLDVLMLMDEATFPGCLVECRLIGVIKAEQEEQGKTHRNDRLIAVATQSITYADVKHLRDLNATVLKQIEAFFINYQAVRGVKSKVLGHEGPQSAMRILEGSAQTKAA